MTTTRTLLLLALLVGAIAVTTTAQGPKQAAVGGFAAQVPENQTPPRPTALPAPSAHRRLSYEHHVSIASRLLPTDTVVEVPLGVRGADGDTDPEREVEQSTIMAAAVVVIQLREKQSRWTESGDWIMTDTKADVQEVLKDTTGTFAAGNPVALVEYGGEMTVGRQRVIAYYWQVRPTVVGRPYLAFIEQLENGELRIKPFSSFEIEKDSLKRLRLDAEASWVLDRQPLGWVKAQVRAKAHLQRRPQ